MGDKNRNLGIKFDAATTTRLENFEASTGVAAVDLGRNAITACLDYFEAHGHITFPLELVPKASKLEKPFTLTRVIGSAKYPSKVAEVAADPKPKTRRS